MCCYVGISAKFNTGKTAKIDAGKSIEDAKKIFRCLAEWASAIFAKGRGARLS